MNNFRDVIDAWPSRIVFAGVMGISRYTVDKWYSRNSIPSKKWKVLLLVAKENRIKQITATRLIDFAHIK